jgi:hypothetical protein
MPLTLTPTQKSAASILQGLKDLASVYEHATRHLDGVMDGIIALPNDQLADLGNEIGATDLGNLLAAHAAQVAGVNQLANGIEQIIASVEGREPTEIRTASTLSLYERLAQQSREIIVADGVFSVSAIPEPE